METAPPCKQVTRTNQPHTHTQTHTQTTVSPSMLACIHSIRHLLSITRSQERTNHVSPLPFITIIHPSINHALHGTTQYGIRTCTHHVVMARTQWNAKFACTPLANHHLTERHTYIHACMHRDENDKNDDDDDGDALILPPTESADEHLRWRW